MKDKPFYGTGKRKTSIARVFMRPGSGKITVNCRTLDDYFSRETSRMVVRQPLVITDHLKTFDIMVRVKGGGDSSQAGAVRLGIVRALLAYDKATTVPVEGEETVLTIRQQLKPHGLLTRDARKVERKKVGLHKARKGTQYSKR